MSNGYGKAVYRRGTENGQQICSHVNANENTGGWILLLLDHHSLKVFPTSMVVSREMDSLIHCWRDSMTKTLLKSICHHLLKLFKCMYFPICQFYF